MDKEEEHLPIDKVWIVGCNSCKGPKLVHMHGMHDTDPSMDAIFVFSSELLCKMHIEEMREQGAVDDVYPMLVRISEVK